TGAGDTESLRHHEAEDGRRLRAQSHPDANLSRAASDGQLIRRRATPPSFFTNAPPFTFDGQDRTPRTDRPSSRGHLSYSDTARTPVTTSDLLRQSVYGRLAGMRTSTTGESRAGARSRLISSPRSGTAVRCSDRARNDPRRNR